MNTALWLGGASLVVLAALFTGWRLRRATGTMNRILDEERERERLRVREEQHDVGTADGPAQR